MICSLRWSSAQEYVLVKSLGRAVLPLLQHWFQHTLTLSGTQLQQRQFERLGPIVLLLLLAAGTVK
jgi:hypothetical protein